jgi:transposase InsO family protein
MTEAAMVTPAWIAQHTGRSPRQEQSRANAGHYGDQVQRGRAGRNQNAILVPVAALPIDLRTKFYAEHPHYVPAPAAPPANQLPFPVAPPSRSFRSARKGGQKKRALLREQAVLAFEAFLSQWGDRAGKTAAMKSWVVNYKALNDKLQQLSIDSVKRWREAYRSAECAGHNPLDALVDGNDGSSRRGKTSIPRAALTFFQERYLDPNAPPRIRRAIRETRMMAKEMGWRLPKSNDPFYDWAQRHIPQAMKMARRTCVGDASKVLPYIERAMERPYRTVQCDHHVADVLVNCEGTVCPGGLADCRAHRPWLTPIMDTGSRKVIAYKVGIETPNSQRILAAVRATIEIAGIFERFHCDNGKDFHKAAGWKGLGDPDLSAIGRCFDALGITPVFSIVRNAQAKSIERWFGTLCRTTWEGTEGYTGPLGKRPEHTKHLVKHPELLPGISTFLAVIDSSITIYNNSPHTGRGMKGRTPSQVFAAERIPLRRPDSFAFALAFWRCEEHLWRRNGVQVDYLKYWSVDPDGTLTRDHFRSRVKILVNPDDVSQAILCTLEGQYLCEARVPELASHTSTDAVTEEAFERVGARRKALKRLYRHRDVEGAAALGHFKRNYVAILAREAASRREEEQELVAAVGDQNAARTVMPVYSKLARDRHEVLSAIAPMDLGPELRVVAARAEDHTDAFLERLLLDVPSEAREEDLDDPLRFEAERSRMRALRMEKENCDDGRTDDAE